MPTVTLTGAKGRTPYSVSNLATDTLIDAATATWELSTDPLLGAQNPYPVMVNDSPNVTVRGGTITGNLSQTRWWRDVYDEGNSAAVRLEDCANGIIERWRVTNAWDTIRVSWNCPNFLIRKIWASDMRDDAMENDKLNSGTISDCLFDGCFAGFSLDPSSSSPVDGSDELVSFEGVLLRLKKYPYDGNMEHASWVKTDSATPNTSTPSLRAINNVIAIEDVNHGSYRSVTDGWAKLIESTGNYYLNLSDDPLPSNYPMPPTGWTLLQGQSARDYWTQARAAWINTYNGTPAPPTTITANWGP